MRRSAPMPLRTLSTSAPTFSQTVSVTPGQVRVVNLPAGTHTGWPAGQVRSNAIRVSGPDDFVLYLVNRAPFTSDAGMALPVDALGTSHFVTTFRGSLAHSGDRSQFLVLGALDPDGTVRLLELPEGVLPGSVIA